MAEKIIIERSGRNSHWLITVTNDQGTTIGTTVTSLSYFAHMVLAANDLEARGGPILQKLAAELGLPPWAE